MYLEIFVGIGLLYVLTGVVLQLMYWGEMPWQVTTMFLLLGTGVFVIVNRWWLFRDWEGGDFLFYLGAILLLLGWVAALLAVRVYLDQRKELSEYRALG